MNYTKGEWKADGMSIVALGRGFSCEVAKLREFIPLVTEANAHLIAATPDMYEALRKVRANIGHIVMTKADAILVDQIDKALAKTEGKPQPSETK